MERSAQGSANALLRPDRSLAPHCTLLGALLQMPPSSVGIIGGGILGLAHAWVAATRLGAKRVVLFERSSNGARGASTLNFGWICPSIIALRGGGRAGDDVALAKRTRHVWLELIEGLGLWHTRGSVHVAHHADEMRLLEALHAHHAQEPRPWPELNLLNSEEVLEICPPVGREGLLGGMYCPHDISINPADAVAALTSHLVDDLGVTVRQGVSIVEVRHVRGVQKDKHSVIKETVAAAATTCHGSDDDDGSDGGGGSCAIEMVTSSGEVYGVDECIVCPGTDHETLFPSELSSAGVGKCRLQMMRTEHSLPAFASSMSSTSSASSASFTSSASSSSSPPIPAALLPPFPLYAASTLHKTQCGDAEVEAAAAVVRRRLETDHPVASFYGVSPKLSVVRGPRGTGVGKGSEGRSEGMGDSLVIGDSHEYFTSCYERERNTFADGTTSCSSSSSSCRTKTKIDNTTLGLSAQRTRRSSPSEQEQAINDLIMSHTLGPIGRLLEPLNTERTVAPITTESSESHSLSPPSQLTTGGVARWHAWHAEYSRHPDCNYVRLREVGAGAGTGVDTAVMRAEMGESEGAESERATRLEDTLKGGGGITVVTGTGVGMTLSFGIAEETFFGKRPS